MNKIKDKWFEFLHGHPRLIEKEVDIIIAVRSDRNYKWMDDSKIKKTIKEKVKQMYVEHNKHLNCSHEKWNCDNQIRTIECIKCGKRAWIEDYVNLYSKSTPC